MSKNYVVGSAESGDFLIDQSTGEVRAFNFTKVDMDVIPKIHNLIIESPMAARLLFYIWSNVDRSNHLIASQVKVVSESGLSKSTVQRCSKILVERNYIDIERLHGETHWYLNERVSWRKAEGEKLNNSRFSSKIK